MVLREGMRPLAIGVAVGLVGAALVSRLLRGLLYDLSPLDPVTFVGVPLVLLAVALLASWWPARRATRVEAILALRAE
jgi:ABC-type lipoprotein release transport system permease subunit